MGHWKKILLFGEILKIDGVKCHTACSHACFLDVLKASNPLYRWIKQSAYELKAIPADLLTSRLEGYSCLSKTFNNGWPQEHFSCPGGVKKMVCDLLPHQKLTTYRKLDSSSAVLFEGVWHPSLQKFGALGWNHPASEKCMCAAIWAVNPVELLKHCTVVVVMKNRF